jgi:hypothetical protein
MAIRMVNIKLSINGIARTYQGKYLNILGSVIAITI